jgi:hypothetical protein
MHTHTHTHTKRSIISMVATGSKTTDRHSTAYLNMMIHNSHATESEKKEKKTHKSKKNKAHHIHHMSGEENSNNRNTHIEPGTRKWVKWGSAKSEAHMRSHDEKQRDTHRERENGLWPVVVVVRFHPLLKVVTTVVVNNLGVFTKGPTSYILHGIGHVR